VRIIRSRTAECVIHERRIFERSVCEILKPATASLITHEDVQLSVRAESHHTAVVITIRTRVGCAWWLAWDGDIVCLEGSQPDDVAIKS
jgi:hypothetical protein